MAGLKIEMQGPVSQTPEAVSALISMFNHGQAPREMPDFYRLSENMVLAASAKKDCYYVVTPRDCSCPARNFNPGKPYKHMRKYFQVQTVASKVGEGNLISKEFKPFLE